MKKCLGCLVAMMLAVFILSACSAVKVTDIPTPTSTEEVTDIPTPTSTEEVIDIPTPTSEVKERNLSTPSSRLVGHWRANTPLKIEYYFSEINPDTGEGTQTEYDPRDGTVFICEYKIFSETPDGKNLTILITAPDGSEIPSADFVIDGDGMNAQMRGFTITYLDNKTEYEPEK